jgi:hypothetical protein
LLASVGDLMVENVVFTWWPITLAMHLFQTQILQSIKIHPTPLKYLMDLSNVIDNMLVFEKLYKEKI